MNFDEIFKTVTESLQKRYGEAFQPDYKRLKEYLVGNLKQDVNNITITANGIEQIVINPISLSDYSKKVRKSYSSIFQNKKQYTSLIEYKNNQKSTYTVAEYELPHFQRSGLLKMIFTILNKDDEFRFYVNKSSSLRSDAYKISKLIMDYFRNK